MEFSIFYQNLCIWWLYIVCGNHFRQHIVFIFDQGSIRLQGYSVFSIYINNTSNAFKCNSSPKFKWLLSTFQPNNFNKIWDFTLKSNAKIQCSEFGFASENFFIFVFFSWKKWNIIFVYHTFSSLSMDKCKTVMRNVISESERSLTEL